MQIPWINRNIRMTIILLECPTNDVEMIKTMLTTNNNNSLFLKNNIDSSSKSNFIMIVMIEDRAAAKNGIA